MFTLTSEPIQPTAKGIAHEAGGVVLFEGLVRDHNEGRRVHTLEYEAFGPLAQREGDSILGEALARFDITSAKCVHRTGLLQIGEVAVRIEVAAPHRQAAFDACQYIIDELKKRVPIWKKEHYAEGESEWLNPAEAPQTSGYYDRQLRLPELANGGQEKLSVAKVLVVGAGGLGCPALLYLAAAGVGTLGFVENDALALDNLHRQILYRASEVGQPKGKAAQKALQSLNPFITVAWHNERLSQQNAETLMVPYDIILDCTDNFATKFLLNDTAVRLGKKLVQASIYQYEGQLLAYDPEQGSPCLRCTWPETPPAGCIGSCAEVGVLGVTPGLFGTLQASEAIKLILGIGETLAHHLLLFDLLSNQTQKIKRAKNPTCPTCGHGVREREIEIEWKDLESLGAYRLIDVRELEELEEEPLKGAYHLPMRFVAEDHPHLLCNESIVFVCAHGVRSSLLAYHFKAVGWQNVYSVLGGMSARD